ncbi:hypothetical protein CVT26_006389 [Gymnopilus dilepis]|uniref:Uncharacterized protein n=1 Tax=Gymnopilus dilepis TaxID=231916 RepID=A0A409Y0K4_9AGAR|nr:hypothetical protein CVT26_006389 [Gymnopilus dilepis]
MSQTYQRYDPVRESMANYRPAYPNPNPMDMDVDMCTAQPFIPDYRHYARDPSVDYSHCSSRQPEFPAYHNHARDPSVDYSRCSSQQPEDDPRDIMIDLRQAVRVTPSFNNRCIRPGCNEIIEGAKAYALIAHIKACHPLQRQWMGAQDWEAACLDYNCNELFHADSEAKVLEKMDKHVRRRHWRLWTRFCPVAGCREEVDGGKVGMSQHILSVHHHRFSYYHWLEDDEPDWTEDRRPKKDSVKGKDSVGKASSSRRTRGTK